MSMLVDELSKSDTSRVMEYDNAVPGYVSRTLVNYMRNPRPERCLGASGRTRIPTTRTMFVLPSTAMDPSSSSVTAIDGNLNRVRALHADGVYAH